MKKLLTLSIAALMLLSLIACGAKNGDVNAAPEVMSQAAEMPDPTAEPTPEPTPEPEDPLEALLSGAWKEVVQDNGLSMQFNKDGTGSINVPVTNTSNGNTTSSIQTIDCTWSLNNDQLSMKYTFYGEHDETMLFVYENGIYTIQSVAKTVVYARNADYSTAYGLYHNAEQPEPQEAVPTVNKTTEHMDIIGFCVDNSYRDKDGSPLKLVYLFYNFIATDQNLKIDSKYTKLTIDGKNTYQSDHFASTASAMEYMPNFYYSSYIKDVYLGTSVKVAATFYIPEGDLTAGKAITVSDSQIPGCESIFFYTDDVRFFDSGEEIAEAFDPDGHKEILSLYEEADAETTRKVKSLINGYYWWCYVNNTKYEVEFSADHNFEVRTSLGTRNTGTYSVRKGFIFCTYTNTGYTIRIPYELKNGDVEMTVSKAFDVLG